MNSNIKNLEKTLWAAADKMRGGVSVTNYKFLILSLIFLKYISDSFDERYNALKEEGLGLEEDRDAYAEENVFFVPENARWQYLVDHAKDYNIGEILDKALDSIEKENPTLKGVLFKVYNDPDNRNVNLGEIIDLFTNIKVGTKEAVGKDLLGHIYEYFLGEFAANELQKGGEFYTPACPVRTMVEIIEDMIALKQDVDKELIRTNDFDLSPEEIAFFDALGDDPEVRELMKDETLVQIAKELVETVNNNITVDWNIKRSAQAHMCMQIKRLLIKYNYPPNKSAKAVETVVKQAELKCQERGN